MAGAGFGTAKKIRRTIAIAGGGVAGLTSALALSQAGFRVLVFEKSPEPSTAGAGIQISPNAYLVLAKLGLARALRTAASTPETIEIKSGISGKHLSTFQLGSSFSSKYDAPYLTAHRADLLQILLAACEDDSAIALRYGQSVTDVAHHSNGVTLLVTQGTRLEEFQALALIGADGVWSQLRQLVHDATPPQYSGLVAWRCNLDRFVVGGQCPSCSLSASQRHNSKCCRYCTLILHGGIR